MSAEQRANQAEAEKTLLELLSADGAKSCAGVELFEVADLLREQPPLLRALTDAARSPADRQAFAKSFFEGKVDKKVTRIVTLLAGQHWTRPEGFADTVEYLGVRSILHCAAMNDRVSQVEDELVSLNQLVAETRKLRIGLSDIGGSTDEERVGLAEGLFEGKVLPETLLLVKQAVKVSGQGRLTGTLRDYAQRAAEAHGAQLVTVTSASELTPAQLARLEALLEEQLGRDVSLAVSVDPELVGGFRINYGDEAADASVKSELTAARRALVR